MTQTLLARLPIAPFRLAVVVNRTLTVCPVFAPVENVLIRQNLAQMAAAAQERVSITIALVIAYHFVLRLIPFAAPSAFVQLASMAAIAH